MDELIGNPLTGCLALSVAFAAGAPWLTRALGARGSTALFGLVPLLQFAWLAVQAPAVISERSIVESHRWLSDPGLDLALRLDGLSLLFSLMITGIGALVVTYASRYLEGHPHLGRFYSALFLFMASMLGLVLSDNLVALFVFWELTSISSYFLIGFDHEREESRSAALQALLVTTFGGLAMLAGFLLLAASGGSFAISELLERGDAIRAHGYYLPALFLIAGGAFTKSAQFPFHFWLPNAMQAPTPVSAYLHSATMVKAGVFLLARLSPALGGTEPWFWLLTIAGACTMVTGAFLSLVQQDLKLILAYLTVSVLGLLVMLLGIGTEQAVVAAMTYTIVHSLYKGSLFLIAGNVDHGAGTRDVAKLRGLARGMRTTAACAALSALSLAGIPLLFGFVGKELILDALLSGSGTLAGTGAFANVLVAATVAAFSAVMARAIVLGYVIFLSPSGITNQSTHEAPIRMLAGPAALALLGLAFGLAPGLADPVVRAAADSVLRSRPEVHLAVWHGINTALLLSLLSAGAGLLLHLGSVRTAAFLKRALSATAVAHPARAYAASLSLLAAVAEGQTAALLRGGTRRHLIYVLVSIALVTGFALIRVDDLAFPSEWGGIRYYEWTLCALMVLGALTAALARSPLVAVAALGVSGYAIALTYVIFGAPDLAMTQFLVETLTVILLALVLSKLPGYPQASKSRLAKALEILVATIFGTLFTALTWRVIQDPLDWTLSEYFARKSLPDAHGRNIVNVILVDFRALDTLGEITVLGLAGLGVLGLVRLGRAAR